jgi:hypothetical protein
MTTWKGFSAACKAQGGGGIKTVEGCRLIIGFQADQR